MPVIMTNRPAPTNALGTALQYLGPAIAQANEVWQAQKDARKWNEANSVTPEQMEKDMQSLNPPKIDSLGAQPQLQPLFQTQGTQAGPFTAPGLNSGERLLIGQDPLQQGETLGSTLINANQFSPYRPFSLGSRPFGR